MPLNAHGQPIGDAVSGWTTRERPPRTPMVGRCCTVVPLDPARHAAGLYEANGHDVDGANFTYLFTEPFATAAAYRAWAESVVVLEDPLFHVIVDARTERAVGVASFMRIDAGMGVIEVGNINYSPLLQRSVASTEAMYLMMRRVFDELGYRRYEWKCDSLNAPSRATALRLGFSFEGVFRQAIVYKGRNRDTAWYSITNDEWPARRAGFEAWLAADNFGADGAQRRRLGECFADAGVRAPTTPA